MTKVLVSREVGQGFPGIGDRAPWQYRYGPPRILPEASGDPMRSKMKVLGFTGSLGGRTFGPYLPYGSLFQPFLAYGLPGLP